MSTPDDPALQRRLGVVDAVTIGLGSMIGAGIFVVLGPAAAAAGSGVHIALVIAALVAYCNATSSARLAALYPQSGGAYVYGRQRLGPFWGYTAGWSFVVGKTASCAAIALTVGLYAWPAHAHAVAVAAVVVLTAVNYAGIKKSAMLTRVIVVITLGVLAAVVVAVMGDGTVHNPPNSGFSSGGFGGVLQAAGLLFFAFAGYARIATLGEEVRNPERTIPLAIPIALGITLFVYAIVMSAVGLQLGAGLTASSAPLADAVSAAEHPGLEPVVRVGAAVAALGSLLSLILGVSRTTLAMARDRHLPHPLAAVHPRFASPHRAEVAVGAVVAVITAFVDVRAAIGFSSFAVLVYYAIANVSAMTLGRRLIPALGLMGCLLLAVLLPIASVLAGAAVVAFGALVYRLVR